MSVQYRAIEICFILRLKIKWEKFHRESSKTTSSREKKNHAKYGNWNKFRNWKFSNTKRSRKSCHQTQEFQFNWVIEETFIFDLLLTFKIHDNKTFQFVRFIRTFVHTLVEGSFISIQHKFGLYSLIRSLYLFSWLSLSLSVSLYLSVYLSTIMKDIIILEMLNSTYRRVIGLCSIVYWMLFQNEGREWETEKEGKRSITACVKIEIDCTKWPD